jgi:hypothetical protein
MDKGDAQDDKVKLFQNLLIIRAISFFPTRYSLTMSILARGLLFTAIEIV